MPPRKPVSEFMVELSKRLIEGKGVAETTAENYIKMLKQLNDSKSFSNLGFLKKKDAVMSRLKDYAESSQKSMLVAVVSALSLFSDKPTYKPLYNFYFERMMELGKSLREVDTSVKTEKQNHNWLSWDDVKKRRDELGEEAKPVLKAKMITPTMWNTLLSHLLLSLYTYIPPRRNQDYQDLYVVKKWKEEMPKDKNYYDLATSSFIFNKYKTSKSHGVQKIELEEDNPLRGIIASYLKVHPNRKSSEVRMLVYGDGSALSSVNSVTRILNKVFGKQVGSSMLRHIYLSDKYGNTLSEMKEDAEEMGHTLNIQREYIKSDVQEATIPQMPEKK